MRSFILGTDWGTDCDDAVALRILTRAARDKKINLKGIILNTKTDCSVSSVDGFLTLDKISGIPIGISKNVPDIPKEQFRYQERLAKFSTKYKSNEDAQDAVLLYRRILAESEDKVEIIEIGFLQALAALLKSEPDEISDKNGVELVGEKVSKLWIMAGKWDADPGTEYNFANNELSRVGGAEVCALCPVPITFLGFEVGVDVITGNTLKADDHLKAVLCDYGRETGRSSWDPMTTLLAVIGDEEKAGYDTVSGTASVDAKTGENHFEASDTGLHKYIIKKYDNSYYEKMINSIIE